MKLMHVDSSPKGVRSGSRLLSAFFVERLRESVAGLAVDYLDLAVDAPPHVSGAFAQATYTPAGRRTAEMDAALAGSDALCARLLAADALLFAMPMYNWSMPSVFKAFIDQIVRAGVTYVATDDGRYVGQLAGKKALFVTTRGADLRPGTPFSGMDALTHALRAAFGFIGVEQPRFVDAQPMQFASPEARDAALDRARAELTEVVAAWSAAP